MKVLYHPDFTNDIRRFALEYGQAYNALGARFQRETREAIARIKAGPYHAGHMLRTKTGVVKNFRRCNLQSFPFFVLYGYEQDLLIFGSLIPSRSDPLTWLTRFQDWPAT